MSGHYSKRETMGCGTVLAVLLLPLLGALAAVYGVCELIRWAVGAIVC